MHRQTATLYPIPRCEIHHAPTDDPRNQEEAQFKSDNTVRLAKKLVGNDAIAVRILGRCAAPRLVHFGKVFGVATREDLPAKSIAVAAVRPPVSTNPAHFILLNDC
jgi:hypothetical protein